MQEIFRRIVATSTFIKAIKYGKYVDAEYYSKASLVNFTNNIFEQSVNTKDKELKVGRKIAQKKLAEMLDIKAIKALEIVSTHKKFCETPCSILSMNYELCISYKLSKNLVLNYPYILTEDNLSKKIERLQMLAIELSNCIPMVKLSLRRLYFISSRNMETTTRIYDLCSIFHITPSKSCEILASKPFLFTRNLKHLEHQLKLFCENGISEEDILKDVWIFKYSKSFIRNRFQYIKEHEVKTIKTWMLRCSEETLYKHLKRESDNRDILGENSVTEYLSERLKCNEGTVKYLIRKQPALQTKSLLKMNEMIDFLYKHEFTPNEICRVPKVLLHSTKTADNRIKELAALGKKPVSLYVLTKSQKQYMQHIETLIKAKAKAKTI